MKFRFKILLALVIFNLVIWATWYERANRDLIVAFIDVGQGDAIFIRTPSGRQVLIDGGRSGLPVLRALGELMPFYDHSLDLVIATHPDEDHIGGLNDVLERYRVGLFLRPAATSSSRSFHNLISLLARGQVPEKIVVAAETLDFFDGARLDFLFPDRILNFSDTNSYSIVNKLTYGSSTVILTGDASTETENYLIKKYGDYLQSDILKAGHHGSKYSSGEDFIKVVAPKFAIISAGAGNAYGHPAPAVLETLAHYQSQILETAKVGTIKIRATPMAFDITSERF